MTKLTEMQLAAIREYQWELEGMDIDEITSEIRRVTDEMEELEPWLEALTARRQQIEEEKNALISELNKEGGQ